MTGRLKHTLVRGAFIVRDGALVEERKGHGRSVHGIQRMPPPEPRNTDKTIAAVTAAAPR